MFRLSRMMAVFTIVTATSFAAAPAFADPVQMLIEKDWGAYRYDDDASRICFVSSVPTTSKANMIQKIGVISGFLCRMARARLNVMLFR